MTTQNTNRDKVDQLRPHSFDGIQEYDNSLPKWWLWLFYITILFTPIYMIYFHVLQGKSLQDELQEDIALVEKNLRDSQKNQGQKDYLALVADSGVMTMGKEVYQVNCIPCHKEKGEGSIGPNLTDKFWIHGSSGEAIHKTIAEGIPEKGMPPWLPVLGADKVDAVTVYVMSMKNTNIAGGKEAQGQEEE